MHYYLYDTRYSIPVSIPNLNHLGPRLFLRYTRYSIISIYNARSMPSGPRLAIPAKRHQASNDQRGPEGEPPPAEAATSQPARQRGVRLNFFVTCCFPRLLLLLLAASHLVYFDHQEQSVRGVTLKNGTYISTTTF